MLGFAGAKLRLENECAFSGDHGARLDLRQRHAPDANPGNNERLILSEGVDLFR